MSVYSADLAKGQGNSKAGLMKQAYQNSQDEEYMAVMRRLNDHSNEQLPTNTNYQSVTEIRAVASNNTSPGDLRKTKEFPVAPTFGPSKEQTLHNSVEDLSSERNS